MSDRAEAVRPPPPQATADPLVLLERVESLGPAACGALKFGDAGMVLVEAGKICWAVAANEQRRLGQILLQHCHAAVDARTLKEAYESCEADGSPLGERLVERGLISTEALRRALLRHTIEGLRAICGAEPHPVRWVEHRRRRYDARFTYAPVEILSALAAEAHPALAEAAGASLAWHLEGGGSGIAFVRNEGAARPVPVSAVGGERIGVQGVLGLGAWAIDALDLANAFAHEPCMVSTSWGDGGGLIAWEERPLTYVAVCDGPSSQAFVLARYVRPRKGG